MNGRLMVAGLYGMSALFHVRELPTAGETVTSSGMIFEGGGKGYNQAISALRMGASVFFVTAVGEDVFGKDAENVFRNDGLRSWKLIQKPATPTAFAAVCTDSHSENIVIVEQGAMQKLTEKDVKALSSEMARCKMLLIQLETAPEINECLIKLASQYGVAVMLNPAPAREDSRHLLRMVDLATPNYGEALTLCGYDASERVDPERLCREIRQMGCKNVIITLGKEGCCALDEQGIFYLQSAFNVDAVDTVGAGDTFNGALAASLLKGYDLKQSVRIATAASAISVTRRGAVAGIPGKTEVMEFLSTRK